MDLIKILKDLIKVNDIKNISDELNISKSTVNRWIELNEVPKQYEFELLKMSNIKIDYSKYSSKEKDQFFTPINVAEKCYKIFINEISKYKEKEEEYIYVEPSAGDGSFVKILPKSRVISMDIEPRSDEIMEYDYLEWYPKDNKKYVVIGNPPFGLRGNMALRFINHSHNFAEYVCFILPQLFESDGKGVPRKRVIGYNLIYSEKIDNKFYSPEKSEMKINTIFQIWSKNHKNEKYVLNEINNENIKVYSLSDGGTPSSTRNKDKINKCDIYIPSTCFGKDKMRIYNSFEELPNKKGYGIIFNKNKEYMIKKANEIDWGNIAFMSTNSAYNLRTSQIHNVLE